MMNEKTILVCFYQQIIRLFWRSHLVQNVSSPLRHSGLQAGENRKNLLANLEQISKNMRNGNINSVVFSIFCRFCPIPVIMQPARVTNIVTCVPWSVTLHSSSSITGMMGSHSQFWSSSVIKTQSDWCWRGLSSVPRDCCGLWTNPSRPERTPSGRGDSNLPPHRYNYICYLKFPCHVIFQNISSLLFFKNILLCKWWIINE